MALEAARAAVESLPGVRSVAVLTGQPGTIAGQVPMHVVTVAGHDWADVQALLPARHVDIEVLHETDHARNLDDLRRFEAEFTGESATRRRAAWQRMAELDAETIALRALLPRLEELQPGGDRVQDPRLQEVHRIVAAEVAFWRAAMAEPARNAAVPQDAIAIAQELYEARGVLGGRRWLVARTSYARIRSLCSEVAAHATATADKARDAAVAAKYRTLADRCTFIAKAIEAACTP
ncbi:MAG: hypothetical protein JNK15_05130 [Planctomycetes bacterium]|nr:hypothetical protein [Planctomycetota bacterium]